MEEREKAYIAGLFDGEGDVGIYSPKSSKNGKRYLRVTVRITNTHRPVLDWVRLVVGNGNVGEHKRTDMTNRKPVYRWQISNANARVFLREILPYLHIKTDKVVEILTERNTGRA